MLHYLNLTLTPENVPNFKMHPSVPPGVQWFVHLRELGVKFDTVLPMDHPQPLGYCRITEDPITRTVKIRQVIR